MRINAPTLFIIAMLFVIGMLSSTQAMADKTSDLSIPPLTKEECEHIVEENQPTDGFQRDLVERCKEILKEQAGEETISSDEKTQDRPIRESEPPAPETPPTSESKSPAPEAPPTSESESPATEIPPVLESEPDAPETQRQPQPTEELRQNKNVIQPSGVLDVSLVGSVNLSASYENVPKKITLTADLQSIASLGLGNKYVIFQIPSEVMQSIRPGSITLSYAYTGLLGAKVENVPASSIQQNGNQIYAEVGSLLASSVLSRDAFTLTFNVNPFPVGTSTTYTFESSLTSSLVDLDLLSRGVGTATLAIGPVFHLTVPETLDFGTHEITGRERIINRTTAMTIEIGHQNALNYDWKLRAKLTAGLKPMSVSSALYFASFDTVDTTIGNRAW